ncbi:polymorphic toxin-type HINT domain-containing protein [Arthrobacter sp. HLT1-20]
MTTHTSFPVPGNHQRWGRLRTTVMAAVTAASLAVTSAGLVALAVTPQQDTSWANERPAEITEVPAVPWAASMQAADQPPTGDTAGGGGKAGVQIQKASLRSVVAPGGGKGSGDFAALPGVSSGEWGVSGQSGSFTWSYPFTLREAPAGGSPSVALAYDSSMVDGLTSSTNNQASVVGDGWSLAGAGTIRQNFTPCMDQGVTGSYDLCGSPGGQQFTIAFGGRSGKVIKDATTGVYKLQNDDNTKIEYLTAAGSNGTHDGGHWKVTDTSGTQYFFGKNRLPGWVAGQATTNSADTVPVGAANASQPCWAGTFAASLCPQAYAWNLDYVVDVQGNTQAFYYTQDGNNYSSQAGTGALKSYVRASRLARIDYGMRAGAELGASAPLRVSLDYTGRCTGVDCAAGTDVPTTYSCAATGTCATSSATFYTDQRLKTVTTQTLVGATYQNADVWTLAHTMPNPGDGLSPALWMDSLTHQGANTLTGVGGAISDPPVVFRGQPMQNRVWVLDGLAQLNRYRLSVIKTVTGATISVVYMAQECSPSNLPASPETNTKRCFPQWWAPMVPIPQAARMDYFHIYPVATVTSDAGPGASGSLNLVTNYQYLGAPGWKYAGPKYVAGSGGSQITWSALAGWTQVKTIVGNAPAGANQTTLATYLRGFDGTPSNTTGGLHATTVTATNGALITDSPWLAGSQIESQAFLGDTTTRLSSTVTVPWSSAPTATGTAGTGAAQARHAGTKSVTKVIASGQSVGTRTSSTTNYFDSYGRTVGVTDSPETGSPNPATCTSTSYADNTGLNLLALPATITTRTGACDTSGGSGAPILKASRNLFDASTSATPGSSGYTAPVKGNLSRSDTATTITGGAVETWHSGPTTVYDGLGRETSSTDSSTGTPRVTSSSYTPAAGLATSVVSTNPLGWANTTTMDTVRGSVLSEVDPNGSTSTYRYDATGRVTGVWDPMRPVATNPLPTQATTYKIQQDAPSWVQTTSINGGNQAMSSFEIYDGLGRLRQTQDMSPGGGTIATDTFYDSAGAKSRVNNDYFLSTEPGGTLMIPTIAVPSTSTYAYDGAGRVTAFTALAYDNQTLWTTKAAYAGADTTTLTGPGNDAARSIVVNSDGQIVSRLQYKGATATGTPDTTSYTFDALGQNTSMADTAGNSWSWAFDPAGRQSSATDPDSGTSTISYDSSGRVSSTTNALGVVSISSYDTLDRVISQSLTPAGGTAKVISTTSFDGEKKGQPSSSTRFNGANYDQPVTIDVSGYNAAYKPKTTKVTLPGVIGALAGSYTTTRTYTKTGQVSKEIVPALGGLPAETLYYGYDAFENPSSLDNQNYDTIVANTQYTHLGQMATFQQYDANYSSPTLATTGRNQTYFSWDATTGRLSNQWSNNTAKSVVSDLGKTSYEYTPGGNLLSRATTFENKPGAPTDYQCYNYDYASRLAAVWTPATKNCATAPTPASTSIAGLGGPAPYAQTYSYTPAGDRSQVKRFTATGALGATEDYTYKPAGQSGPHQLQSLISTPATGTATTSTFLWDAAGQMTNRAGETLSYTPDGHLNSSTGASTVPVNPNPSATLGTPPAPDPAVAGSASERFYDSSGALVALVDGTGTTVTLGSTTAHNTKNTTLTTATCTYTFAGKTVAQRTAALSIIKLSFVISDGVDTAQTVLLPTDGTTNTTAITRYTDPMGLTRGATQTATGAGAYTTAPTTARGVGTNGANTAGFGATNGYIGGLADSISNLTHLGARDLDPVLGLFTSPDPILQTDNPQGFTPYAYSANDPINYSDPSGLSWIKDLGSWVKNNAGTIVKVVVAVVVVVAVTAAVAGCIASVVCGIVVGAAAAAAGYAAGMAVDVALGNKKAPTVGQFFKGMAQEALWGGLGGGLGVLGGALIGKIASTAFGAGAGKAASSAAAYGQRLITQGKQAAAASAQVVKTNGAKALASVSRPAPAPQSIAKSAASACSFAGATTVLMADGTHTAIQDIKVNDTVIASDPETGEQAAKPVDHMFVHEDTVFDLIIDGQVISTTEDHPFWSVTDQKFERADELATGEQVLGANGATQTITALQPESKRDTLAYNLSIDGIHTYHVGTTETLVHNTCSMPADSVYNKILKGPPGPNAGRLDKDEATDLAQYLGYRSAGREKSYGQPIFKNGKDFITPDNTGHVRGTWKKAKTIDALKSDTTRQGTYDPLLRWMAK